MYGPWLKGILVTSLLQLAALLLAVTLSLKKNKMSLEDAYVLHSIVLATIGANISISERLIRYFVKEQYGHYVFIVGVLLTGLFVALAIVALIRGVKTKIKGTDA